MKNNTSTTINHWHKFNIQVLAEGLLVGAVSGLIVVLYRLILNYSDHIREEVYNNLRSGSLLNLVFWFGVLIGVGILMGVMVKKVPMIKGSGIPQIKGFLIRQLHLDWLKEIVLKFFGGILSLGFGLSLGREGPSVQLGATAGLGVSKILKRHKLEEKYMVTAGASAGLAAAFNAPLAGVIFALEELHRNFSPLILTCVMGASIISEVISSRFFGLSPVFNFENMEVLPVKFYGYIVLLSIIIAFSGKLFNQALLLVSEKFHKVKLLNGTFKPVIPLVLSGILGLLLPITLGGGHELIMDLTKGEVVITFLIIVFVVKFLFTVISYGSGVPGGIFLPILVLGALIGKAFGQVSIDYLGLNEIYTINMITLGMAAYFTAVVKAPITGSILITEMTGSFNHLLPLIIVSMVAYVITDLINSGPIYDMLLEKMLEGKKKGNYLINATDHKALLEIAVCFGSSIEHKRIKEIDWPEGCLIVGIKRGEREIIPKGEYKIYAGDYLIILTDENQASLVKPLLLQMASETILPEYF